MCDKSTIKEPTVDTDKPTIVSKDNILSLKASAGLLLNNTAKFVR